MGSSAWPMLFGCQKAIDFKERLGIGQKSNPSVA